MITITKATQNGVKALSRKILKLMEDKNSLLYQDNVVKFGIPEEYVKKAFNQETLLEIANSGEAAFYLALENRCEILGFAQIIQQDLNTVELDRILVFPKSERKGIGTQLLNRAIEDQKKKGIKTIIVKVGKDETHAKKFYEKNGFEQIKEETIQTPWNKILTLAIYQLQVGSKGATG